MNIFFPSLILGIAFAAPPGIVTTETIRRGVDRGFKSALILQLGSIIGDLVWAAVALSGLSFLFQSATTRIPFSILGIFFLFYLSYKAFRDYLAPIKLLSSFGKRKNDFFTGALISLSNPFAISFWAGASTTIYLSIGSQPDTNDMKIFFLAFFSGALIWSFFLSTLVSLGRKFISENFFRYVNLGCSFTFLYFAFRLAQQILNFYSIIAP